VVRLLGAGRGNTSIFVSLSVRRSRVGGSDQSAVIPSEVERARSWVTRLRNGRIQMLPTPVLKATRRWACRSSLRFEWRAPARESPDRRPRRVSKNGRFPLGITANRFSKNWWLCGP